MLQRKDQDRHKEQRWDQLEQPPGEKAQHGVPRVPGAAHREALRRRTGTHLIAVGPGSAEQRKDAAPRPGHENIIVAVLTSASTRSRAPARPAFACNLQAWWYARSGACGDRDK